MNLYCCDMKTLKPRFEVRSMYFVFQKKVREKSRECHNYKPQPFPDTKKKRKQTKPNKRKSNKRTKSTKISPLFPKQGIHNAKRAEKHKNKITQSKTKKKKNNKKKNKKKNNKTKKPKKNKTKQITS